MTWTGKADKAVVMIIQWLQSHSVNFYFTSLLSMWHTWKQTVAAQTTNVPTEYETGKQCYNKHAILFKGGC